MLMQQWVIIDKESQREIEDRLEFFKFDELKQPGREHEKGDSKNEYRDVIFGCGDAREQGLTKAESVSGAGTTEETLSTGGGAHT